MDDEGMNSLGSTANVCKTKSSRSDSESLDDEL